MRPMTYNSFHDNDGNLLHGRLKFFKKNTQEYGHIENAAGRELPNPIFTNNIGQPMTQVFLDNYDYTIQVEKYIGNGLMELDTDQSMWVFQYSMQDVYETIKIDVDTKGLQLVATVEELRHTNPATVMSQTNTQEIILAGYNNYGDKPTVHYVWDPDVATGKDNGGSIICCTALSRGAWVIVNEFLEGMDVRHFGVFPAELAEETTLDQSYQIHAAYNYTSGQGIAMYFPATADGNYSYYRLDNLNIKNVKIADNVRFVVSSKSYMEVADGSYAYVEPAGVGAAQLVVTGNSLKTSEYIGQTELRPREYLICDGADRPIYPKDVTIKALEPLPYDSKLDHCVIYSGRGFITEKITLSNMEVKAEWFADGYNYNLMTLNNCIIDLKNFDDLSTYIKFKNIAREPDYGDLEGKTLKQTDVLLNNFIIKNAKGTLGAGSGMNGTIEDSTVTSPVTLGTVTLKNSTLTTAGQQNLDATNSTITETATYASNAITLVNSTYNVKTDKNVSYFNAMNSKIYGGTRMSWTNPNIGINRLTDCTFSTGTVHTIYGGVLMTGTTIGPMNIGNASADYTNPVTLNGCRIEGSLKVGIFNNFVFNMINCTLAGQAEFTNPKALSGVIVAQSTICNNNITLFDKPLFKWDVASINWFDRDDSKHNYNYFSNNEATTYTYDVTLSHNSDNTNAHIYYDFRLREYFGRFTTEYEPYPVTFDWQWKKDKYIPSLCFSYGTENLKNMVMNVSFETYTTKLGSDYVYPHAQVWTSSAGGMVVDLNEPGTRTHDINSMILRSNSSPYNFKYHVNEYCIIGVGLNGNRVLNYQPYWYTSGPAVIPGTAGNRTFTGAGSTDKNKVICSELEGKKVRLYTSIEYMR